MTEYMIEAEGLRKSYGEVQVIESVDLAVERGTMLALLGPNGAGKTTAVRILSTLLRADGGTASIGGYNVATDTAAVRSIIGLTGQDTAVDGLLTGEENLVMMGRLFGLSSHAANRRSAELLRQFDLQHAAKRPAKNYSGGMRRRLDLAISMLHRPAVLFLDEPTTGLDPTSRETMWDTIRSLMADGTTVLLTTQYLEEADQLAHRIAVIDDGRVVAEGTADELKNRVGAERIELTFDPADLATAYALFAGQRLDARTLSLPAGSPQDIHRLLNEAAEFAVPVRHMEMHRPTLDDVFRAVTDTAPVATGIPGGKSA